MIIHAIEPVKLHEETQMFMTVDYVMGMTVKKSCVAIMDRLSLCSSCLMSGTSFLSSSPPLRLTHNVFAFKCQVPLFSPLPTPPPPPPLPSLSDRLVGIALVVRRPPRERKIPGSNPACAGIFSGSSHTSDLKIDTPVATLPGAWRSRVSTGTGRPDVSIL